MELISNATGFVVSIGGVPPPGEELFLHEKKPTMKKIIAMKKKLTRIRFMYTL